MEGKTKLAIGVILIILIIIFGRNLGLFAMTNVNTPFYASPTSIVNENNYYVEYEIPITTIYKFDGCSNDNFIDFYIETLPSQTNLDWRDYGGGEMLIPASSPAKRDDIEINKEFYGGLTNINANVLWYPCSDLTRSLTPLSRINASCRITSYSDSKQNIRCHLTGQINGISSQTVGTYPPNTEINFVQLKSFSSAVIRVKFYKITACNTPADTNCDSIVDRTELGVYINSWISGIVTRDNLGQAIVAWIS